MRRKSSRNFSRAESPHRHWSSRQVTPVAAKSALFPWTRLIPTPAFHHESPPPQPLPPPPPPSLPPSRPPASPPSFIHHHLLRLPPPRRGTRHVTDSPSPLTSGGPAYLPPVAPLPLRRGLSRQVHQPKCHSAYLCVCAYQGRGSVSGGQVLLSLSSFFFSLSLLFLLSLSLSLFLFLSPLAISSTVFFPPYLSPYLCMSPSHSFFLPLLSLSIRLSSSTSLHAAVPCCSVVSSRGTSTILPDWRQGSTGSRVHSAITGAGRSPVYSRVKKVNPAGSPWRWREWFIPDGTRVLLTPRVGSSRRTSDPFDIFGCEKSGESVFDSISRARSYIGEICRDDRGQAVIELVR